MRNFKLTIVLTVIGHALIAQNTVLKIETFELDNGLKVFLNEDRNASNVYGAVWVNAGGKNDPADATGIAHYLEHMLFKGTTELGTQNYELEKPHLDTIRILYDELAAAEDKNIKLDIQKRINEQELKAAQHAIPNEFDKLVKSIGGTSVNAGTSFDYTNYYNIFPGNQLEKWLEIYAHRFQNPVFRLFQSELEVVYEEKNRAADDLERRVTEKFQEYIYGDHPYSTQTVLGDVEHIKNPSLSKMYKYFQDYYVSNNMALVLCGNFSTEEAKPLIEKSFGKLKRGKVPELADYERSQFSGRVLEKVRITPIKAGFMGYKLVPYGHPDQPALDVIDRMMSNQNETGFIDKLTINNEVLYAGGYSEFLEDDGSTFIFYVPKLFGKSLKKFEEQIRSSFQSIAAGNFTEEYMESVKNGLYRNLSLSQERIAARGRYLGLSFVYGLDYKDLLSYSEKIKKLSKKDIQLAAATYYGDNYFTMQSRTGFPKKPKLKKPPYKPISSRTELSSAYAQKFKRLPERTTEPRFIEVDRDLQIIDEYIYCTNNPLNDVFTITLNIATGLTQDPYYAQMTAALDNSGTTKYSVVELKNEFAKLGATYSFGVGYSAFTISVTGLDREFERTMELVQHLLEEFDPKESTIENLYNQRKTENKINKNNPSAGGRMLYAYGLFGEKSAFKKRIPIKELKQLKPTLLKTKLESMLANGFNDIHYVGQKDKRDISTFFTTNTLFRKNKKNDYEFLEAKEATETTIYLVNDKKAIQSYVYYIVNGEALDYESTFKKEAFNSYYTNSLSGLLFQEVREFRSLAYSTGGDYFDPIYEPQKNGRLVLFTGSQADKTTNAVEVVLNLIEDMPVYETRIEPIKQGLILESASSKPGFRDLSETADEFLKTGFSDDPNKINYGKYAQLTFDDVKSFYEDNIKGKPVTVTIYGDASKLDKAKLNQFGKVIELEMKDIMVE
ncbi:MAG: insulinase family protein [Bacteroidota bacterium]